MIKKLLLSLLVATILCTGYVSGQSSNTSQANSELERIVEITTSYGAMKIKLYNETPIHRDNFIKLIKEGFYNDLLFHRVVNNFMIQGGDPDSKGAAAGKFLGDGGPGYDLPAEIVKTKFHKKGALAAARLGDSENPEKASSGSQFYLVEGTVATDINALERRYKTTFTEEEKQTYLNIGGAAFLDKNYTVFGEIIEGMEVLEKISDVQTGKNDRPEVDVKMKIKVIK